MLFRRYLFGYYKKNNYGHYHYIKYLSSSTTTTTTTTTKQIISIDENFVHERHIKICKRFGKINKFLRPWFLRYIPPDGYPISIRYIDTDSNNEKNLPVIVLLHGTPGSYYDYFRFIVDYGKRYRLIIPNFPDFTYTINNNGCFWHSAEEKSELICDLLNDLNINNVDCLISHSLSAYTASYLWLYANQSPYFNLKSLCLLCPIGKFNYKYHERLKMKLLSQTSRFLLLRKYYLNFKLRQQKQREQQIPSWPTILGNNELAIWKMLTENLSNYQTYSLRLEILVKHLRLPTLFLYSSNDKLYSNSIYFNQLFKLQVMGDEFDRYELYENQLIQYADRTKLFNSDYNQWILVVDFSGGGHYLHNTHSHVIHSYINELLDFIKK